MQLADEILEAADHGKAVEVTDPATNRTFVVLAKEHYERVRVLLEGEDEARAMYPHLAKTFGPDGWDEPEMDAYDALDPRRHP